MKKQFLIISGFAILTAVLIFSCKKKADDTRITPTYKEEGGTGGNPHVGDQTVTGTATLTNPATANSQLQVGGSGWSNPTCISTSSITLKGINGSIDVTLNFLFPPSLGTFTYGIAASPGPSQCSMIVNNAPNQPSGIVWYGKTGQVTVNTSTAGINASFTAVQCIQSNFNFPQVTVSGVLGCN